MFSILNYPGIVNFINQSFSYHLLINWNSEWIVTFCPFCNDVTRKYSPKHGHLNFNKNSPFVHCFRCGYVGSLSEFLVEVDFLDTSILTELAKYESAIVVGHKTIKIINRSNHETRALVDRDYDYFRNNHITDFIRYYDYIDMRIPDCNPINFFIKPGFQVHNNERKLICQMMNSDMQVVNQRIVPPSDTRYIKSDISTIYYFQSLVNISNCEDIIICEGVFDLINLYNSGLFDKNGFYVAMNGSHYVRNIINIISNFLMIGNYNIHIIIDNDMVNEMKIIGISRTFVNMLNDSIDIIFYRPSVGKDVSEFMQMEIIH